jgi:uncharacterized protein (TIGR00661 family)
MIIFYSVGGEGMGHATRSEVVIRHLLSRGYFIVIFSYDRAFFYLKNAFKKEKKVLKVIDITGFNYTYEDNEFKLGKTVIKESKKIKPFLIDNPNIFANALLRYNPTIIISDFEPMSCIISNLLKIPLICVDNINFIAKCRIDKRFQKSVTVRSIEYSKTFEGDYNFITTVFDIPLKEKFKKKNCLIGPIIRKQLLSKKKSANENILVYQTSQSNNRLFEILKETNEKYIVYGFNKSYKEKNLAFKKPNRYGFSKDLLACKAVITNGGFSLISEAVFLNKPIYSIPVKKQTEQEINGFYIKKFGFGMYSEEINRFDLEYFLAHLEEYKKNLAKFDLKENDFALFDEKIRYYATYYRKPSRYEMLLKLKNNYDAFIKTSSRLISGRTKIRMYIIKNKAKQKLKTIEKRLLELRAKL